MSFALNVALLRKYVLTIVSWSLVLTLILAGGFLYANRPELVVISASVDPEFPGDGFSHDAFEQLLKRYVDQAGNVDYQRWHDSRDDRDSLESYLAAVARYSPASAAGRFAAKEDALAYWLYAYNAYVIHSILQHWPIDSVTDVRAPVEAVRGLGFFYRQRFLFGGDALSLYTVEHDKILSEFRDPRVHFVLNCASKSCPVLKPELPTGAELEQLLESSAYEFVNDTRNVYVDTEGQRVVLSTIFKWYRKDFENELRRRGLSSERGVVDYLALYAAPELVAALGDTHDYAVVFEDYDWSLNRRTVSQN